MIVTEFGKHDDSVRMNVHNIIGTPLDNGLFSLSLSHVGLLLISREHVKSVF